MGRVLSEEVVKQTQSWLNEAEFIDTSYAKSVIENLIATIRDRDKAITDLLLTLGQVQADLKDIIGMPAELNHPSLTLYRFDGEDMDVIKGAELRIRDTIAKVKGDADGDQRGT